MRVVDTHFHWYPRDYFERMAERVGYPRTERVGDGYRFVFNNGNSFIPLPAMWFDLDEAMAVAEAATGPDTAVVCTAGVLTGLLDQMPVADAVKSANDMNEALATVQREMPGRFYGTASIPLQDTGEALAVLDHAISELGLHGVNLPSM